VRVCVRAVGQGAAVLDVPTQVIARRDGSYDVDIELYRAGTCECIYFPLPAVSVRVPACDGARACACACVRKFLWENHENRAGVHRRSCQVPWHEP